MRKFKDIRQFIESLKKNRDIVGILEYGGRCCDDMSKGGDYDLTVITRTQISKAIGGVHFHIDGIPVDCMIKSIDDFMRDDPTNRFDLVHLNCKVLFDRGGITHDLLERINRLWKKETELSKRDISWIRFTFKHVLDKLEHRLHEDTLYSNHFMSASLDWFLQCYAKIKKLEMGKPKSYLKYIKEYEPELYDNFARFYETVDINKRFGLLKICAEHIAESVGGLWKNGEILFHLNSGESSKSEQDNVLNLIFGLLDEAVDMW